ncbi:MAG: replication protein [Gammaproteobacteria bacterium]|nr:replication protein [Gammaproteobacteria bacterium]
MSILVPESFQVKNFVVDQAMRYLNGSEVKCLLVLIRQTLGWQKSEESISVTTFMKFTGLSNRAVIDAMKFLRDIKIALKIKDNDNGKGDVYSLNLEWSEEDFNNLVKVRGSEESSPVIEDSEESSPVSVKKVHQQVPKGGEESSRIETNKSKPTNKPILVDIKTNTYIALWMKIFPSYKITNKKEFFGQASTLLNIFNKSYNGTALTMLENAMRNFRNCNEYFEKSSGHHHGTFVKYINKYIPQVITTEMAN